jgi:hypothetical protein
MTWTKVEVKWSTDKEDVQEEHGDVRSINDREKGGGEGSHGQRGCAMRI